MATIFSALQRKLRKKSEIGKKKTLFFFARTVRESQILNHFFFQNSDPEKTTPTKRMWLSLPVL